MTTPLIIQTVTDQADYTLRTRLDGRDYGLHMLWNQREGRWYLTISDYQDNLLIASIKLVTNWSLLDFYQYDPNVPPGKLLVTDSSPDGSSPGIDELGPNQRCQLVYVPATDL